MTMVMGRRRSAQGRDEIMLRLERAVATQQNLAARLNATAQLSRQAATRRLDARLPPDTR